MIMLCSCPSWSESSPGDYVSFDMQWLKYKCMLHLKSEEAKIWKTQNLVLIEHDETVHTQMSPVLKKNLSRVMRKPTICICENKDADQLRGNTPKLISALVFATWIVQYLFFLNTKFQASSHLQWLYSLVCVRPGQNSHCWFSHVAAHLSSGFLNRSDTKSGCTTTLDGQNFDISDLDCREI